MSVNRSEMIKTRLQSAFNPVELNLRDDSHKHAGHTGNKGGGGHFTVLVVAEIFQGKSLIQRHRMVYDALGDAMESEIHALSIKAITPDEYNTQ